MRKKIIILTYSLGGAGAERVVANLLNYLDRGKYDIELVLMNTLIEYEIPAELKIHFIEKSDRFENEFWKFIKLPSLGYKFAKHCNKEKADLVLAVMNRPNFVATFARVFGTRPKILISERFYTPYYYNKESFAGKIKVAMVKWLYPKADAILPNSQGTVEALQSYYQVKSNFHVVKNPTDLKRIQQLAQIPLAKNIYPDKFTFINVATFRHEKNHDLLIDAVAEIRTLNFQLVLIGKGESRERIKQKVAALQLNEKVFFVDFTDNPYQYMQRANCFLLSSLGEGFPNVLIESMACGLPIISADCKTGPRELLAPGTNLNSNIEAGKFEIAEYGLLCANNSKTSLAAAMRWALENTGKLEVYKEKGIKKANDFEIKNVCDEFSVIFDTYLKK